MSFLLPPFQNPKSPEHLNKRLFPRNLFQKVSGLLDLSCGYCRLHPPAMSVRKDVLEAPNKKVEGGADLHCPNLTSWFRAALAAQTLADCGAKKWVFPSWERCRPTHKVVKLPSGISLLSPSTQSVCLVLSGKSRMDPCSWTWLIRPGVGLLLGMPCVILNPVGVYCTAVFEHLCPRLKSTVDIGLS